MNKLILDQLNKTKVRLPDFDNSTTELLIKRADGTQPDIATVVIGKSYILYIEDYIIHEPSNFTLSTNWNNGTTPFENKVRAQVTKIMGKMIYIVSVGITSGFIWEGWLPQKGVSIIEEL